MSDKSFTFFEFHFHDRIQLGPKTLGKLGDDASQIAADDETGTDPAPLESDTADEESGGCLGCKLIGLGVLAAAAYAIRKLLAGEPRGLDALDNIDDLGAEDADEADDGVAIEVTSGEESASGSNTGLLVAAAVALLLLVVFAVKKLLGGSIEELDVPDELAEE